jgi:hypothetical protein
MTIFIKVINASFYAMISSWLKGITTATKLNLTWPRPRSSARFGEVETNE